MPNSNPIKAIVEGIILLIIAALVVWVVFYRESFTDKVNELVGRGVVPVQESEEIINNEDEFSADDFDLLTEEELQRIEDELGPPVPLEYESTDYEYRFTVPVGLAVEERVYFAEAGDNQPNHIVEMRQPNKIDVAVSLETFEDDGSGLTPQIQKYLDNHEVSYAVSDIQSGVINEAMGEARSFIKDEETYWFFFHPETGNYHVFYHRSDLEDIQELVDQLVESLDTL